MMGIHRDIDREADLMTSLQPERQLEFLRAVVDATVDAIIVHEPSGALVFFNAAACDLLSLTPDQMQALSPYGWIGPETIHGATSRLELILHERRHKFFSSALQPDGSTIPTEVTASRFDTDDGPLVVAVIRDISERAEAQQRLEHLAYHDALTGLPNRTAFDERLRVAIADSKRYGDVLVLAYVDLDRFKPINDQYGHAAGDEVLTEVAMRLQQNVRAQDVAARLGGDEFVVLFQRVEAVDEIAGMAERLLSAVRKSIRVNGAVLSVDASIGFAIFDPSVDDARSLLVKADIAMYEAKRDDGDSWLVYREDMGLVDPQNRTVSG